MPNRIVSPVSTRDSIAGKACVRCGEWRPLEMFAKHRTCAGGRRNDCSKCEAASADATEHRRLQRIAACRRYQQRNPDKMRVHRANACAKRRERVGAGKVTAAEVDALMAKHQGRCAYCGAAAESLDHVLPLARGGAHVVDNLVPACLRCNKRKHAMTPAQWRSRINLDTQGA